MRMELSNGPWTLFSPVFGGHLLSSTMTKLWSSLEDRSSTPNTLKNFYHIWRAGVNHLNWRNVVSSLTTMITLAILYALGDYNLYFTHPSQYADIQPTSVIELRSFLWLSNVFRRYHQLCAYRGTTSLSLEESTVCDLPIAEQQITRCNGDTQILLMTLPILALPYSDDSLKWDTNACHVQLAIGWSQSLADTSNSTTHWNANVWQYPSW